MASTEHPFRHLVAFNYGTVKVFIINIVISISPAIAATAATALVSVDLPMRVSNAKCRFQLQPLWRQSRTEEDSLQQDRTLQ